MFPDCIVLKNDPTYQQGMLDLTILFDDFHASLEVKDSESAPFQPNQEYFLDRLNKMSFASRIYPENEGEILLALQQAFEASRRTRVS